MNSPWGIEFMIIEKFGWTRKYLLWGESWLNIQLMIADAPAYRKIKTKPEQATDQDIIDFFSK